MCTELSIQQKFMEIPIEIPGAPHPHLHGSFLFWNVPPGGQLGDRAPFLTPFPFMKDPL